MNAHKHLMPLEISFKHCDPAGIVFYPRYVEMLNDVVEHWFQHALGCSFAQLHLERALAIPVADLHCGFIAPSRLGDALEAELQVAAETNTCNEPSATRYITVSPSPC